MTTQSTFAGDAARDRFARLPDNFTRYLVTQRYDEYTESDHRVWREVLARWAGIYDRAARWLHPEYVEGMRALALPTHVPRVEEINERLAPTGWSTVCVDGYIPNAAYVGLMAQRVFPISRALRRPEHVDYSPSPDMVHDIVGHLPMLFSPEHRTFLKQLATVMMKATSNPLDDELYAANRRMSELKTRPGSPASDVRDAEARVLRVHRALASKASELTHLARMYLWSVEFGLIGAPDDFKVYGAALLSSPAELLAVCERRAEVRPYSIDVIHTDIAFSDLQAQYFVARDFDHLREVVRAYDARMRAAAPWGGRAFAAGS